MPTQSVSFSVGVFYAKSMLHTQLKCVLGPAIYATKNVVTAVPFTGVNLLVADTQLQQPQLHRIQSSVAQVLAYSLQDPPILDLQALGLQYAYVAAAVLDAFVQLAHDVHSMDLDLGKEHAWQIAARTAQLSALQHVASAANSVLHLMTYAQVMEALKAVEGRARPAPGPGPLLVQCAEVLVSERCGGAASAASGYTTGSGGQGASTSGGLQMRVACLVATLLAEPAQAQLLLHFEDSRESPCCGRLDVDTLAWHC